MKVGVSVGMSVDVLVMLGVTVGISVGVSVSVGVSLGVRVSVEVGTIAPLVPGAMVISLTNLGGSDLAGAPHALRSRSVAIANAKYCPDRPKITVPYPQLTIMASRIVC